MSDSSSFCRVRATLPHKGFISAPPRALGEPFPWGHGPRAARWAAPLVLIAQPGAVVLRNIASNWAFAVIQIAKV